MTYYAVAIIYTVVLKHNIYGKEGVGDVTRAFKTREREISVNEMITIKFS